MKRALLMTLATLIGLVFLLPACGHSEDEWQGQLKKYDKLLSEHNVAMQNIEAARQRVQALEDELRRMGVDMEKLNADLDARAGKISQLSTTLEDRERALAEYKKRAEQLERIKARFELLRKKLEALTSLGLEVKIRNNRMIISLPGDVLFESGRDDLKKEGESVIEKVASIINGDDGLRARFYQVAGHTDNVELRGGMFYDNWGLSLLRARKVLLFLIKTGLPAKNWSAAGFADTDPIADNETPEGKQKNRRCEIVVVPSAEEMLDLRSIVQ